jgi:soluble lytic murein transglycosylase-like protein
LLFAGCAAPVAERAPVWPGGPLHDAVSEWAPEPGPRPAFELAPLRMLAMREEVAELEPSYDLRPFNEGQIARIARVQSLVRAAARAHDVPADLVNGIIWVESQFQVQARSRAGAHGLMQLMPSTGREVARMLGRSYHPFDPEFNIHAGTYYFAHLLRRFEWNLRFALAAYNCGPGVVDTWVRYQEPMPAHSRHYVDDVLVAARAFRAWSD